LSSYLGGNESDSGSSIAVDGAGSVYVTGYTYSQFFPTTPGALQPLHHGTCSGSGCPDAFVTRVNADGSLAYSTYLGGSNVDCTEAIAVDGAGNAYVTGFTRSSDFPTTAGAIQPARGEGTCGFYSWSLAPCPDAFVTKLSPAGGLAYSTYLGGGREDSGTGI